ncbi:ATP-grasp domain-containing protein [Skermania sp. ID1734]|uniref:acetyl/propionyl/methylcrotonyl-CoA carboxylase subunit alpha n=1 Tax=Skermania sp. ID1734 TaxID=2597516 RepID=UPI00118167A4|nr:biotin carboxylase N-terminal domain-containing protein [Skermania sp. ID1734]TSE01488.1 ATP-grasp domain-containing protein [Skermania sp. ID1734]
MINRVLVANRGEIARRIFRTCRDSGIATVAVASDADLSAPHAREADIVVALPGTTPAETYLRSDLIIAAAQKSGADAVHPGYGFLSENADFARAVIEADLTWIGPDPKAIEAMGSKIESKRLMAAAGVPVLGELEPETITDADLPVLVKASAGGGGRGMRVVRSIDELAGAVDAARKEAASAFGDPTVFCEPYLQAGRHIEVQILADRHGQVWALGERECSIQRRHQKVLEEAPSPLVDAELRERLCAAATAAAKAVDYVGAGTVEFLADNDGRFFFLEMNTRLQVEHPVTECVSGIDLVAWQLRVAEGEPLPTTDLPVLRGHAIEARLYAEDPGNSWMPTSGPIHQFAIHGVDSEFAIPNGFGLRLDGGFGAGDTIGVHYDGMLAKVIAWAPSRAQAARRLAGALAASHLHGPVTNRDLLVRVLRHPEFIAGRIDTAFFERDDFGELAAPLADEVAVRLSALAAALAESAANHASARILSDLPSGWRNVTSGPQRAAYSAGSREIEIEYRRTRAGLMADGFDDVRVIANTADEVVLDVAGARHRFAIAMYDGRIDVDSLLGAVTLRPIPRFCDPAVGTAAGSLLAPMPAVVVAVHVDEGDAVAAGQPVVVLEAMKMQHTITAPTAGIATAMKVTAGQQVETNQVLAVIAVAPEGDQS